MPKNKLRPSVRAKAPAPKHRAAPATARKVLLTKVKPAPKIVATPKTVETAKPVVLAKTIILTKPVPLPKPSLSVKPVPKNTPVIIPPRPNANGLHPRPGVPSKPMLPFVKPVKPPMVAAIPVPTTTPVKVESTIPPGKRPVDQGR